MFKTLSSFTVSWRIAIFTGADSQTEKKQDKQAQMHFHD
jgi:hypothetical protein